MRKILLMLLLILVLGLIPTASAISTLTIGAISYDGTPVKNESTTVRSSISASSISGTVVVNVTLTDNSGLFSIPAATKSLTFTADGKQAISWTITATSLGNDSTPVTIQASGDDGSSASKTLLSLITVQDSPVISVTTSSDNTSVVAGDTVIIRYTVSNSAAVGAASATNTNIALVLPRGWSLTGGQSLISDSFDDEEEEGEELDEVTGYWSLKSGISPHALGTLAPGASTSGLWVVTADYPSSSNTITLDTTSSRPGGTVSETISISGPASSTPSSDDSNDGEPTANIAIDQAEHIQKVILKDQSVDFSFKEVKTPVMGISFYTLVIPPNEVEIHVQQLYNRSVSTTIDPPGEVYTNLNIIYILTSAKEIKDLKIKFKVKKNWLDNKGIESSEIALYRWNDNKWNALLTTQINADSENVYYTADTPSLSAFAISTKTADTSVNEISPAETTLKQKKTPDVDTTVDLQPEKKGLLSSFEIFMLMTGLLAVAYIIVRKLIKSS